MEESQARAGDSRRLFEFLAASRPERERRGALMAAAASVAGHAAIIGVVTWATVAAAHAWSAPDDMVREDVVELLTPTQSRSGTGAWESAHQALTHRPVDPPAKHAFAPRSRAKTEAPLADREREAAPSVDPVRTVVELEPLMLADATAAIDDATRDMDRVFASLHESEFGGIGQDSASSRVAAIVDDHHEPTAEQLAQEGPHIGSFTQAPELTNPDQVQRLLSREYPEGLKEDGVGGRVLIWFLVDETGKVRRWFIKRSSGHAALDKVAMRAAPIMRFRPAWNYDRHVPLWIVLPITFIVDEAG